MSETNQPTDSSAETVAQDAAPVTTSTKLASKVAKPAQFDDLQAESANSQDLSLDVLLDVPVTLSLEVGRTKLTIRELLSLSPGSIVEFGRSSGDPLDVFVNGTLIARGEVVVIDDRFGLRLTEVLSPAERIRKLK